MLKSFVISFKLRNTYRVNSIIYSIKQLPIIKKILPNSLYKNRGLKIFANIISILMEIIGIFIGKLLYILIMIVAVLQLYKTNSANIFLHIFMFLTLCGALLNTYMFNPTKDKYYAMILMNMDAKKYTLSNYYYSMLKVIIGFLPFTIIFGLMVGIPLLLCLILPIFVVFSKMIVSYYAIYKFKKTKKATNENLPTKITWGIVGILLVASYGLPFLGITINIPLFLLIFTIIAILGVISFIKINKFTQYKRMYKQILTNENVYAMQNQTSTQVIKDSVSKQIEYDEKYTSNKNGFAFFHELFVKRHRKILTEAVKKQFVIILVILIAIIIGIQINESFKGRINGILMEYLPYFVFIMYILNRGTTVTQAMFMNCDHSMLSFRIYRTPKVLLGVFKERLKTLITINLFPATEIGVGLAIMLFLTGGTDNYLNYGILFMSIIAMSIFFSVHYLVMYYLLQPYNVNTEMKSSTYKVVQAITYLVCYYMIQVKLPTLYFGIFTIIFSILYCVISLVLVYRLAPQTFKLRV